MVEQKKKRFGWLWWLFRGVPWSEKSLSLKIRAVVVYSIIAFIFGMPFIMMIFGISPEQLDENDDIVVTMLIWFIGGGIVLALIVDIWGWYQRRFGGD